MNTEQLYSVLEDQLSELASLGLPATEKRDRSFQLIQDAIGQLNTDFADKAETIAFQKHTLPRFLSLQYHEQELFYLQDRDRSITTDEQKAYYRNELSVVERFFGRHEWLYHYYRLGATELDQAYFLTGNSGVLSPALQPGLDQAITPVSNMFAQFRAFELLRSHLLALLDDQNQTNQSFIRPGRQAVPLRWTGSVIHAVELAYAIWLSDQVNRGEAELADIVHWLSTTLQVDLSRYTRLFVEIKGRKRLSGTKFLELLRDALNRYIDRGDAIRPAKRIKKVTLKKLNAA